MKLRCKNCDYQFESDKASTLCPNCGEQNSLVKEQSAEELIGDVSLR